MEQNRAPTANSQDVKRQQQARLGVGRVLNGRYRIDALLGQGGMGAVYRAWDLELETAVAVKENLAPLGHGTAEAERQFEREAHILDNLSHPNLPRVTDHFFVPAQGQYLVMDFVEGEDLQARLERGRRMSEPEVLAWAAQICSALAYLHSQAQPIIHHDVKPANIKIRPDGKAMLVDFGIAGVNDPALSATGGGGGKVVTPGYSPPEQYGGVTDARSDIYALGATLYHVLTGRKPPPSPQRVWGSAELLPLRYLDPRIAPETERAILRAMDTSIDRRFQSVAQFQAALLSRAEEPAPQKSTPGLAQWWPLLAAVLLILALAILAAFILGSPGLS
jgi:serine/threonine protein kinase